MQGIGGALAEHKIPLFLDTKQAKKNNKKHETYAGLNIKEVQHN